MEVRTYSGIFQSIDPCSSYRTEVPMYKKLSLTLSTLLITLILLGSLTSTGLASSGGVTARVSVASDGSQGNNTSGGPAISADGRYIGFSSASSNLVPGDTSSNFDVFVYDRNTGQTDWISAPESGSPQALSSSATPSFSADGRFVAFQSYASNLVAGDTNNSSDVFVRDRLTGQTERVSVASDGTQANGNSFPGGSAISADGRYVVFHSLASNLVPGDTNRSYDVFLRDRQTGQTQLVSMSTDGIQGNSGGGLAAISANGRVVAFESFSTNLGSSDTNGQMDVYARDLQSGETELISVASDGTQANSEETGLPSISADGRFVSFYSTSDNLVNGDTNIGYDIFVRDRLTGETTRVSVASDGSQDNRSSDASSSISGDGRFVTFVSWGNLVPEDTNGIADIFVHDRQTGQTQRVSVASDGTQTNADSYTPVISSDGSSVAFDSQASNLVYGDTNNKSDVFVHDLLSPYDFNGFFQPVDNSPIVNLARAGSAIPVKFSLNGDQGLNILATGYPKSQMIACDATATVDGIEETIAAGSSSLSYDASADTYTYVWKTEPGWANTCRQLVVKFVDGTYHRANFKFK